MSAHGAPTSASSTGTEDTPGGADAPRPGKVGAPSPQATTATCTSPTPASPAAAPCSMIRSNSFRKRASLTTGSQNFAVNRTPVSASTPSWSTKSGSASKGSTLRCPARTAPASVRLSTYDRGSPEPSADPASRRAIRSECSADPTTGSTPGPGVQPAAAAAAASRSAPSPTKPCTVKAARRDSYDPDLTRSPRVRRYSTNRGAMRASRARPARSASARARATRARPR